jgi:hypothetical protein
MQTQLRMLFRLLQGLRHSTGFSLGRLPMKELPPIAFGCPSRKKKAPVRGATSTF